MRRQDRNLLSAIYQEVPVGDDEVSQTCDEESEVGAGDEEGDQGDKDHPALQQWHRDVGGGHKDPHQTTQQLHMGNTQRSGC